MVNPVLEQLHTWACTTKLTALKSTNGHHCRERAAQAVNI